MKTSDSILHAREELRRSVAGKEADAIRRAFATFTEDPPDPGGGVDAIVDAIENYRKGHWITNPSTIAYLLFQLQQLLVRDMAWAYMDPAFNAQHVKLWTDLTRYAVPGLPGAAPASLLAFVAWQSGNGALANVAVDRALADDPRYSMALLLRQVITAGAPPSLARLPMSPEEVAASYDEAGSEAEAEADEAGPDSPVGGRAGQTCGTIGCRRRATHTLTYSFPEFRDVTETDTVCQPCGDGYLRRPTLKASLDLLEEA